MSWEEERPRSPRTSGIMFTKFCLIAGTLTLVACTRVSAVRRAALQEERRQSRARAAQVARAEAALRLQLDATKQDASALQHVRERLRATRVQWREVTRRRAAAVAKSHERARRLQAEIARLRARARAIQRVFDHIRRLRKQGKAAEARRVVAVRSRGFPRHGFIPPGPCVRPKGAPGCAPRDRCVDLDGDGVRDWQIPQPRAKPNDPERYALYVVRGRCGHFVGVVQPEHFFHGFSAKKRAHFGLRDLFGGSSPRESRTFVFDGVRYQNKDVYHGPCSCER